MTPDRPLRRNLRFQGLWAGAAASAVAVRIAEVAYPLVILAMTGSPALAGLAGAVQATMALLTLLPGGLVADRGDRRLVLLVTEAGRALALASLPLALTLHRLTLWHLLVVSALLGVGQAVSSPVRLLALRSVVPAEQLRQALAQEGVRANGAELLGPPLAGLLFGLGRALPYGAAAAGFLLSALSVLAVPFEARSAASATRSRAAGGLWAGVRYLRGDPAFRTILLLVTATTTVSAAVPLILLVSLRAQGVSPHLIGLALSGAAVGGLAGTALTKPLHRRLSPRALILTVSWLFAAELVLLGAPIGATGAFLVSAADMLGVPALVVMVDLLVFQRVPDAVRGRVMAATSAAFALGAPVGGLLGGALLQRLGPPATAGALSALLVLLALAPATAGRSLHAVAWSPPAGRPDAAN
ncbi:MFS transporter [Kitasatospora sp. NPDC002227]|uniref:MFS transporter n=1 Tax=Kitasatospora sp. NPDC002227 TaxID=3154773 RepID=UPI0033345F19